MKKLEYNEYGGTEVLKWTEASIPEIDDNEVLVQVKAAGINPTDTKIRKGEMKFISMFSGSFPRTMGLDFGGIVTAVGSKVTRLKVGDPVYGGMPLSGGSFADYIKAEADKISLIPTGLNFAEASTLPLNGGTAIATVNNYVEPVPGMKILVNGASGGVGLFVMQICKAKGAIVTATCGAESMALLKQLGADEVIDFRETDVLKAGKLYDVIVDASSHMRFSEAQDILEEHGSFCTLTPDLGSIGDQLHNVFRTKKEKNVLGQASSKDMEELISLITSGKVKCVVGKTYPLADAIKVQEYLESGEGKVTGKVVLTA